MNTPTAFKFKGTFERFILHIHVVEIKIYFCNEKREGKIKTATARKTLISKQKLPIINVGMYGNMLHRERYVYKKNTTLFPLSPTLN